MAAELAVTQPAPVSVDIDTLKYLGYDPANVATRALVALAVRYQLDPLLGEIQLIADSKGRRLYITRDGMLAVAHRSGQLDGITVDQQRRNSTDNGWTAYVSVWRKDMSHPFTYGAQCKDSEPQAKAGNGLEMALARAERRALRRAFQIRTDFYPDHPEDDIDVDYVEAPAAAQIVGGGDVAPRETTGEHPSVTPTDHPDEFIVPTKEQTDELKRLLALHGLDGRTAVERANRLEAFTSVLGRPVTNTNELSRRDVARLIDAFAGVIPTTATDEEEPY